MISKFLHCTRKYAKRLAFFSISTLLILLSINHNTRQNLEEQQAEEDNWIEHLCPKYTHRDTSSDLKLEWIDPTNDTIFFTETSCGKRFYGRQVRKENGESRDRSKKTNFYLFIYFIRLCLGFYSVFVLFCLFSCLVRGNYSDKQKISTLLYWNILLCLLFSVLPFYL